MTDATKETEMQKPGVFRRAAAALLRVSLTLAIAAIAVAAVTVGSQELTRRADAAPAPDPAAVMPVATKPIVLSDGYDVQRSFVGQIEAPRTSTTSFELSGRLNEILVDEGDTVAKGQLIASLDTRLLTAERDRLIASKSALAAQLRFAKQTVERQSRLSDQGFASQAALDEALSRADELSSRIAETEAALTTNAIQTEKSQVVAPFGGRITERYVDGGESIAPGQSIVEIAEIGAPHIRVGLPLDITEQDLAGSSVAVAGDHHGVTLIALRPDVDPTTRTRTAIFEISTEAELNFGQTARLLLTDRIESAGLWVPATSLKEGVRGQWTLLGVDADNKIRAMTVQVLHADGDRVFVQGAFPEAVRLVAGGPQRVTVGQTVDPQPAG